MQGHRAASGPPRMQWFVIAPPGSWIGDAGPYPRLRLNRDAAAGLAVLGLYGAVISLLNTAAAPVLLAAAPRDYRGRTMAVFVAVNQLVSAAWIAVWGWLASTVLRTFRAAPAGLPVDGVSLIFLIAGGLVIAAGALALAVLPQPQSLADADGA